MLLSRVLAPASFLPRVAWAALMGSGEHAGTWGDAWQLAQVEMAPVRMESCCLACVVDGALPPALHGAAEFALARPRPDGVPCVVKRGVEQVRSLI